MLIGFTGPKGSGKTTIALELSKLLNLKVVPLALPLKILAYKYLGVALSKDFKSLGHFYQDLDTERFFQEFENLLNQPLTREEKELIENLTKSYHETRDDCYARKLLQFIGTDVGRKRDPDIWVNYHREHVKGTSCIVDDVRFPNEAEYVLEDGIIFYLKRPALKLLEDNHESEQHFEEILPKSIVIVNEEYKIREVAERVYKILTEKNFLIKKEVNL